MNPVLSLLLLQNYIFTLSSTCSSVQLKTIYFGTLILRTIVVHMMLSSLGNARMPSLNASTTNLVCSLIPY